jgi:hypothetical protein
MTDTRRDYAFYETEGGARRFGWLVRPVRGVLRRLLGPVWTREHLLLVALDDDIRELRQEIAARDSANRATATATTSYLTDRLDALERQVHAAAAAGWDQTALARRLLALEEKLDSRNEPP